MKPSVNVELIMQRINDEKSILKMPYLCKELRNLHLVRIEMSKAELKINNSGLE